MELMTLDSSYQPKKVVENYESLIWTERYSENGDFELKGSNVSELVSVLPLESPVCIRESNVPMLVEAYKIEKNKNAAPLITITGRSFETVLDRRAAVKTAIGSSTVKPNWVLTASKASDAAYLAIRTVLGDTARYLNGVAVLPAISPAVSANDAISALSLPIPNDFKFGAWSSVISYNIGDFVGYKTGVYQATTLSPNLNRVPDVDTTYWTLIATISTSPWGTGYTYEIQSSELYSTVIELLKTNSHGIRAVRPTLGGSKVNLEIYNGANLTQSVVFDVKFDQIDDGTYFLTSQGSKNVGYVYGPNGATQVLRNTGAEPSDLARRVLLDDLVSESDITTADARNSRGLVDIYQNNPIALFDGEVADKVAKQFNVSYFLGDIVKLVGEYGISQDVRVTEFIRTQDSSGEKAYPTLESIS